VRPYHERRIQITDKSHGWKLGSRVLPAAFTIHLDRYTRLRNFDLDHPPEWAFEMFDLTDEEFSAFEKDPLFLENDGWLIGQRTWLELDVESSSTVPPRCVAMRAPQGISTDEQRFPLAGLIAQSCAAIASKNGSFELGSLDFPATREDYEDALFEANRARRRRRTREAVTDERLAEVARIALDHPRTPTEAVRRHLHVSRGYARRLIKQAEAKGLL
jgi:hypothetical protein